ncbi:hypothetical protein [Hamadaea tsunoensis]|uniref:hypothetical protein n=1 Tax=Hamadaea tsunoensis TaxID=53368 RepID=UPI00047F9274|nr:hypothetical protein [Hamadaea tsunoensis]
MLDRGTRDATLTIDGGDYHADTVPSSVAFVEHGARTVVIHRTAWNRLEVSEAATGQLATPRQPTAYRQGEPRPEHYLDYFHGRLYVCGWVASTGVV